METIYGFIATILCFPILRFTILRFAQEPALVLICGSGITDDIDDVKVDRVWPRVLTPFGWTSGPVSDGHHTSGKRVLYYSRHGKGGKIPPHRVNYRANAWFIKLLVCRSVGTKVLALTAHGSLKEDIAPETFVIPRRIHDKTKGRPLTFFDHLCVHCGGTQICAMFADQVRTAVDAVGVRCYSGEDTATVTIPGPQFGDLTDARLYRLLGFDVVGMTTATEAKAFQEVELCYVAVAMVTDFDCWHPDHGKVTVLEVLAHMAKNNVQAKLAVGQLLATVASGELFSTVCGCAHNLDSAVQSDIDSLTWLDRLRYGFLLRRFLRDHRRQQK